MPDQFLHGIEIIEVDDGIRPIRTVRASIIGVCGTAPNSAPGTAATLVTGNVVLNTAIQYTAVDVGIAGNQVTVKYTDPLDVNQVLAVSVIGSAIDVSLATDASGVITSTAALVITAVNANVDAAALVTAANWSTSDGSGVLVAQRALSLSGGVDEPFPLNTPVLCTNRPAASRLDPSSVGGGTLPDAMDGIYDQAGAVCVVVRVDEGVDDAATITNILGGVDGATGVYTGLHCFESARDALGVVPRILIAPGFSNDLSVANELNQIAESIKAVSVIDGPDTTDEAALQYAAGFDSARLYMIDPWVRVRQPDGAYVSKPGSPRVAGLIAKSDQDTGYWASPSNQVINGVVGTTRAVSWSIGDPSTRANILNEGRVATVVYEGGYRLLGDRSLSLDSKWQFLNARRVADMLNESVMLSQLYALDRQITLRFKDVVAGSVNSYIRQLMSQGALKDGRCIPNEELNTPEAEANGNVYFDMQFRIYYPAEHITFRSALISGQVSDF